MVAQTDLKHFYIPDEQSIYLLSHKDAKKLKDWFKLCTEQLERLGYQEIELIGKGAFGFAFAGKPSYDTSKQYVFKFSRANLPQHVQDRLEEEAYMLGHVAHPYVPSLIEFQRIKKQSILVMQRATGKDMEKISLELGPLSPRLLCNWQIYYKRFAHFLKMVSQSRLFMGTLNHQILCLIHSLKRSV